MVVARIMGCDGWLTGWFFFFFFPLSNMWICVVGRVEVGGFVLICWWYGWSMEWWWIVFCEFVGGCLDLLRCEILHVKYFIFKNILLLKQSESKGQKKVSSFHLCDKETSGTISKYFLRP